MQPALPSTTFRWKPVFGPAYKGIPLAAAAAVALADKYQKDVNFCFDRKEVK